MSKQAIDDNVEALSRAILSEARAEADHILAEARAKADTIRQQAEQQAEEQRKQILARANEEAERLRGQTSATSQMKARSMQLEHREKILNQVFQEAQKELPNMQKWTEYPQIVENLLREALMQINAPEVQVRADPNTFKVLSQQTLEKVAQEAHVNLRVGDPLERGTGVIVESADGRRQYDNTLETRLNRMQNNLRATVYHILMGESE